MIRKNQYHLRRYCLNLQDIENYQEAVQSTEQYDLHHRREIEVLDDGTLLLRSRKELIEMNLYYHRPPEDLIFLKRSEHIRLHSMNLSSETREKRSVSLKGKYTGENSSMYGRTGELAPMFGRTGELAPFYGKKHSKESIAKISAARSRVWRQRKREALANSLT